MREAEVLIIGGGIAGTAAALAAASAGARTVLVRRSPGATALCAGGWAGVPPEPVRDALAAAGLLLHVRPATLPHPDGRVLSYDAAPASHIAAHLGTAAAAAPAASGTTTAAEHVLVCGFAGLPSFHATALAALWSDAASLTLDSLAAVSLTLADTPAAGWSGVALAARLDREPQLLATPLARAAREHGATRVIVPAVLGLGAHAATHESVQAHAGVPVGEALGVAPSVPGWRLDLALLRALDGAGVSVITGVVTDRARTDGTVRSVTVTTADGTVVIRAAAFVLATGRFIGGGITAGERFVESALDTVLAVEGLTQHALAPAASLALTRADRSAAQPVLGIGVPTDDGGRPVAANGDLALHNVFVAGTIRCRAETAERGLGGSASDGWRAGTHAATRAAAHG